DNPVSLKDPAPYLFGKRLFARYPLSGILYCQKAQLDTRPVGFQHVSTQDDNAFRGGDPPRTLVFEPVREIIRVYEAIGHPPATVIQPNDPGKRHATLPDE